MVPVVPSGAVAELLANLHKVAELIHPVDFRVRVAAVHVTREDAGVAIRSAPVSGRVRKGRTNRKRMSEYARGLNVESTHDSSACVGCVSWLSTIVTASIARD